MIGTIYLRDKTTGKFVAITALVGPSNYDLAKKNGFEGSEQDYLESLIGNVSEATVLFTIPETRANIISGDKIPVMAGKIAKVINDLKPVAFSGDYTDLSNRPAIPSKVSDLSNDSGYQTSLQVQSAIAALVNGSPEALDTLQELATALGNDPNFSTTILSLIGEKVAKIEGKSLSTNDFTDDYKANLDYDNGSLELTSVASIPSTKKRVYIEISANATLSFLEILQTGEQTVFIKNIGVASITVTLPSDASYVNTYGTSLVIPASSYAEVSRAYMKAGVNNIRAAV